jgi:ATP-dependent RNA helicase RhlE
VLFGQHNKEDSLSFSTLGLNQTLLAQIGRQGYQEATPIQAASIPTILEGRDVIGLAQTGTGKTAAFVLPILQRLMAEPRRRGIRALVLTPTRELAEQINQTVVALAAGTGLRSATVYGGVGMGPQEQALRDGVPIIVACPGRLLDHLDRGYVRLDGLETLVLDEADRMLDMGFLPAIKRVLKHLPAKRQTLLFSATLPEEITELAASTTRNAARIQVDSLQPATTVTHALYPVPEARKVPLLLSLLRETDTHSVLVFTRTKHRANRLAQKLEAAGYSVARLHGNRSQNQRQIAMDGFRDGTFQVLVATDIAARGIDVSRISHVVNFDIPDTPEAYIHRIGRTGRAAREGDAFTLVTPEDRDQVRAIERRVGQPIERRTLAGFDYDAPPESREHVIPQHYDGPPRHQRPGQSPRPQAQPARHEQPRPAHPVAQRNSQQPRQQPAQQRQAGNRRPNSNRSRTLT